jgi:hypothetical protein
MPRCLDNSEVHAADRKLIAIFHRAMGKACSGFFAKHDLSASAIRKFAVTADEIRMQVRLNDVLDFQVLRCCCFDVVIDVTLRIDNRCFAVRANQVRRVRKTCQIELLEIHFDTFERLDGFSVERILSQFETVGKQIRAEEALRETLDG